MSAEHTPSSSPLSTLGPAREGLDRERQEILGTLERKRQEYEPLHKQADRAISKQMRVYNEILDLERRLAAINEAIEVLA